MQHRNLSVNPRRLARVVMEQFDQLGFEVVEVPFWDVAAFGGGLHCATADVYREGKLEDYFPHQIPGF